MKSEIRAEEHQHSVKRFWHNYLSILEKSKVPKSCQKYYRNHVEMYIKAHSGLNLRQHTLPLWINI